MEEAYQPINWEIILWTLGGFGTVVSALLTFIVLLIKADRKDLKEEQKESRVSIKLFSDELKTQQKEIYELAKTTNTSVELIKQEQVNNNKRMELFEKHLMRKKSR